MSADNAFCSFCNNARLVNNNLIWIISLHSSHPIKITLLWLEHYDLSTPQWCFVVKHFETVCDRERRKFMKFQFLAIKFTGISRCVVKFKIWIMNATRLTFNSIMNSGSRWNLIFAWTFPTVLPFMKKELRFCFSRKIYRF